MDVLAFIKARLKPKTRRPAEKRAPNPETTTTPTPEESADEATPTTGELEPTGS
jgi:hypothetical protein